MAQSASGHHNPVARVFHRHRRLVTWGLLAAVVLGAIVAAVWLKRQNDRATAIQLALAGKGEAAEPLLAEALERDPDDVEVLRAQALGYLAAERFAEAEEPLVRWRVLRPGDPEPHLARIDLATRLNRLPEAIEAAQAVLAFQPETPQLRERLAQWLFLVGRTAEADLECRRCRDRHPNDPGLRHLQAEIRHQLGDHATAEALVVGLLRDNPRYAPALTLQGALYLDAGQPERAIPVLRDALAQGGGQTRARHYLSLALAQTGQEEEARRVLAEAQRQRAVELWEKYGRSERVGYKVSIAETLLATGEREKAVQLLELAVAQAPDCAAAHRLLAAHFESQGQAAKAAEHRRQAGD